MQTLLILQVGNNENSELQNHSLSDSLRLTDVRRNKKTFYSVLKVSKNSRNRSSMDVAAVKCSTKPIHN